MEKKNKKKRVILELAEIFWVEICGFYWDFFPEHTGVSARQRAGTLESVVQYDQETFAKVWDYPASNSSDGEYDVLFYLFIILKTKCCFGNSNNHTPTLVYVLDVHTCS